MPVQDLPLQIIDISQFDPEHDLQGARALADQVVKASNEVGFIYVTGLQIPPDRVSRVFELARGYFEQPQSEKLPFWMDKTYIGYNGVGGQILDPSGRPDNKEVYNFAKVRSMWGHQHPGFDDREHPKYFKAHWNELEWFSRASHSLALRILQLIAIGLRIPDQPDGTPGYRFFDESHNYDAVSGDTFRILHYPPPQEADAVDDGALRIGADDTGGLQIRLPKTLEWVEVPPVEGAIVVNL
ncbi:hypothetical protein HDU93_008126 [Gonapodya sp. JEL0774]|nr:hypothetical protein HDU93_008126 [Gonapodya sp. JEL0774]